VARLIDPRPRGGALFAGTSTGDKAQDYAERVAKYVPAEVIAAYLTLLPIVLAQSDADTARRTNLLALIFFLGVVFTPLYLWRFPGELKVKWFHLVLSTAAFALWTYSIRGGWLEDVGLYDNVVAPILLVAFTLASGLIAPTESST
jgi:hypothetical protein